MASFNYTKKIMEHISKEKAPLEDTKKGFIVCGSTFLEAIQTTAYQPVLDVKFDYNIYLEKSSYHRFLMVRSKTGKFPYIILEITTDAPLQDGDIIPVMRTIPSLYDADGNDDFTRANVAYLRKAACRNKYTDRIKGWLGLPTTLDEATLADIMVHFEGFRPELSGTVNMSIKELCVVADSIREDMTRKRYNLLTNNCQHFCNRILLQFNLPQVQTTLGIQQEDQFERIFFRTLNEADQLNSTDGKCIGMKG